ncbi:hypothetical protein BpHYR1_026122 [Brachionus plicatilis]|uniref:Uncharacterized protein n=1 Tax=Brachionus plicatilis TaxID=10195 RepID=A0A3M7T798_BRAPC|nr:hypothetical protein BpHYR1_026122 [Brachionus plicatilis]
MSNFNSYSNPEYMSFEDLNFLIEDYKRKKLALLNKPVEKFNTLPSQKPPKKRPPSPPRTPPPILSRKPFHSVPLYQNVPNSISQFFSHNSPNSTMIVKESMTPPKPLMTSSRLQLNPFPKQPSKNVLKNFRDIQEEFSLDEEQDDSARVYESTRIKARSPNGSYNTTQEDMSIFCSNPNYYYLQSHFDQELKSPDSCLIDRLENLKAISPPSPFKEGSIKKISTHLAQLSPSGNCLLTSREIDCSKEILPDNMCCCSDVCLSCCNPEACSSTSTSGYKSNQSNFSNYSLNSPNLIELNQFIAINMQRLDRLKNKRKQLIKNSSSCNSANSNGI